MPFRLGSDTGPASFTALAVDAMTAIERTAALLGHAVADALKAQGTTRAQYDALRALRHAGDRGLCRHELAARLTAAGPDVTRLLDRLVAAGLAERDADPVDRRFRNARITPAGRALVDRLDGPVAELHRRILGHLTDGELRTLVELLATARDE